MRLLVLCALLAACDARLGANASGETGGDIDAPNGGTSNSDGGTTNGNDGGGASTPMDAPVTNACSNNRVVFLNFAGDTLTQATASDATHDEAIWVGMSNNATTATMPEWRPTAGDRTTQIQEVVTTLQGIFGTIAPTITFVTTRPAAGPYVMIGFGGTKGEAGVPYTGAVNHLDCGDTNKSDVGWIFESEGSVIAAANAAAGAIAFGLGATGTTDPNDCMCSWLTQCTSNEAAACSFSATAAAELDCAGETDPQNDVAILDAFCN
ncbi:MAG TPA: hypothetical protein VGG74_09400 [Kofleriaceae bacterium]